MSKIEDQEKQRKVYEKIEKKLYSDINSIHDEVVNNPSKELRYVLFMNYLDLCEPFFKTLPMSEEGEDNFIRIFDFVFDGSIDNFKSNTSLQEDFKRYFSFAVEYKYERAIDKLIDYFKTYFNPEQHFDIALVNALETNNFTFLKYLLKPQGEDGKVGKFSLTQKSFFINPNDNLILNKVFWMSLDIDKELFLKKIKFYVFEREDFLDELINRVKIFNTLVGSCKTEGQLYNIRENCVNTFEIFNPIEYGSVERIFFHFKDKNEVPELMKFINSYKNTAITLNRVIKDRSKNSRTSFSQIDETILDLLKKESLIAHLHKVFIKEISVDKMEKVHQSFEALRCEMTKINENLYSEKDKVDLNNIIRSRLLEKTLKEDLKISDETPVRKTSGKLKI